MRKILRKRKGQGLVEYALLIAGVALIAAVGVSMFGHKVTDIIDTVAAILPGAHSDDNGPIAAGHLIEMTGASQGGQPITLDVGAINTNTGTYRLQQNLFGANAADPLVAETDTMTSGGDLGGGGSN
jgi:Flp pilus assembly pilin Flp